MKAARKTYVQFAYSKGFSDEMSVQEVSRRNPYEVTVPEGVFAFRFFDVVQKTTDQGIKITGPPVDYSGVFYAWGCVLTLEEVRTEVSDSDILVSLMEANGLDKVIQTRTGHFKPFNENDVPLDLEEVKSTSSLTEPTNA